MENQEFENEIILIGENNPERIAAMDITKYYRDENIKIFDEHRDIWVISPSSLINKETRRLNRLLGLHKINKFGSKMGNNK